VNGLTVAASQAPVALPHPSLLFDVFDEERGSIGCIVIDTSRYQSAFGPVVSAADVTREEVLAVARAVTDKLTFLRVPLGGASAGIVVRPGCAGAERTALMQAFGRSIAPLAARDVFYPGADRGTTVEDLHAIMVGAGRPLSGQQVDSARLTAVTAFETVRQVAAFAGLSVGGLRIGLQGFGKVGAVLAGLLSQAGARLVAVSTSRGSIHAPEGLDVEQLLTLRRQYGGQLVRHYPGTPQLPREAVLSAPVDILIPGAHPHAIDAANAHDIQARWLVPFANAAVTGEAEEVLLARGIQAVPDFVTSCGGLLLVDLRAAGFGPDDARFVVETTFAGTVAALLRASRSRRLTITAVARAVSMHGHDRLDGQAVPSGLPARIRSAWRRDGLSGLGGRIAWRLHRRRPRLPARVHALALATFVGRRLGSTLERAIVFGAGGPSD
jgi:glutamate dehydrogenase/leucine dehydrogenase